MLPQHSPAAQVPVVSHIPTRGRAVLGCRCDRCGAPAYVQATLESGLHLMLCGHHARQHQAALIAACAILDDHTYLLTR